MEVPPLRDRREDIPELIAHFIRQASIRFHVAPPGVAQREVERAQGYDWPGNVRELQNVIERAVIVCNGGRLTLDLPQSGKAVSRRPPGGSRQPNEVIPEIEWRNRERDNVLTALRQAGFRVSGKGGAAELLGINPATLASRMKALRIDRRDYVNLTN